MRHCHDEWEQMSLSESSKSPLFADYFQMKIFCCRAFINGDGEIYFRSAFTFPTFIPTFSIFIPARAVKLTRSCNLDPVKSDTGLLLMPLPVIAGLQSHGTRLPHNVHIAAEGIINFARRINLVEQIPAPQRDAPAPVHGA